MGTLTYESGISKAWEAWAAAGFVCGLNGWFVIHRASVALKSLFPKEPPDEK
jgi:hypothetical protein